MLIRSGRRAGYRPLERLKVHFAVTNGNMQPAVRNVPGWPMIVDLRRRPPSRRRRTESSLYLRWYCNNIWLFIPVQQKLKSS